MAKCIQRRSDLETRRVTDKEASRQIAAGQADYASKKVWRLQGRSR